MNFQACFAGSPIRTPSQLVKLVYPIRCPMHGDHLRRNAAVAPTTSSRFGGSAAEQIKGSAASAASSVGRIFMGGTCGIS